MTTRLGTGLALLALTLPAPAQGAQAASEWGVLDGVAVQAGDSIITFSELDRSLQAEMARREVTTPADRALLTWGLVEYIATTKLEPQAGMDLGFNIEEIRGHIKRSLALERRQTGALDFSTELEQRGFTYLDREEAEERSLYRDLWQRTKLGRPGLPGTRPVRDRFVRPGQLFGIFRTYGDQFDPPIVQMEVMVTPVLAWGDRATAHEGMGEIRARIEEGESFEALRLEINPDEGGLQPPVALNKIPIPGLRDFAATALTGALSPLLDVERGGDGFVLLARLINRQEPDPQAYDRRETQAGLRQTLSGNRDNMILTAERSNLLTQSYSWVHPMLEEVRDLADKARRGSRR